MHKAVGRVPLVPLVQSGVHGSTQPGTRQLNLQTSSSQVNSMIMKVVTSRKKKHEESEKRSGQWSTGLHSAVMRISS